MCYVYTSCANKQLVPFVCASAMFMAFIFIAQFGRHVGCLSAECLSEYYSREYSS